MSKYNIGSCGKSGVPGVRVVAHFLNSDFDIRFVFCRSLSCSAAKTIPCPIGNPLAPSLVNLDHISTEVSTMGFSVLKINSG